MGGGLDAKAGTIDALDTILTKVSGGEVKTWKEASAEIKAQVAILKGTIQGKYAEYYGKVAGKVAENQGYVEKELGRLEGLIKKGGLANGKMDDLVSRSNILRKFKAGEIPSAEDVKEEL